MSLTFLTAASIEIGLGHLSRIRTLAQRNNQTLSQTSLLLLHNKGFDLSEITEFGSIEYIDSEEIIIGAGVELLVVDLPQYFIKHVNITANHVEAVLYLDNVGEPVGKNNFLFKYPTSKFELGPRMKQFQIIDDMRFMPLRRDIVLKKRDSAINRDTSKIPIVAVIFGGTDSDNLLLPLLDRLTAMTDFKFRFFVGKYVNKSTYQALQDLARENKHLEILFASEKYVDFVESSDLAIITFGQTFYEVVCLKTPSLVIHRKHDDLSSTFFSQLCTRYRFMSLDQFKSLLINGSNQEIRHLLVSLLQTSAPKCVSRAANDCPYCLAISDWGEYDLLEEVKRRLSFP